MEPDGARIFYFSLILDKNKYCFFGWNLELIFNYTDTI